MMVGSSTLWFPFLEAVAIGIVAGLVGVLAVMGRRVFFAESLSHATFPGAVLGVVVAMTAGWSIHAGLFFGAGLFCIPLLLVMRGLSSIKGVSATAASGFVLTSGFALGIFLLRWFSPLPVHVESFLVGSLTTVSPTDVAVAGGLACLAVVVVVAFRQPLVAYFADEVAYRVNGGTPWVMRLFTSALICATLAAMIPAVGTILSLAVMMAPAAILTPWVDRPLHLLIFSPLLGAVLSTTGLFLAAETGLSAGGTIAVVAGVLFSLSQLLALVKCT